MWHSAMFMVCLVAALAGTPLRQAEAAGDLARSMAELEGGDLVEEVDGGVGDDSGATILRAGGTSDAFPPRMPPATACGVVALLLTALPSRGSDARRRADRLTPPVAFSARRHAWLQCFLF